MTYAQVFRKEDVDKGTVPIANKADLQLLNAVNAGMSIAKPKKVRRTARSVACHTAHIAQRVTRSMWPSAEHSFIPTHTAGGETHRGRPGGYCGYSHGVLWVLT